VYCRQCSIPSSSLFIMLTMVLVLVFSYCIGYYDNQINKLNMVNWLNGEMGLNTQLLSLTL
jgi:hypothetical protein